MCKNNCYDICFFVWYLNLQKWPGWIMWVCQRIGGVWIDLRWFTTLGYVIGKTLRAFAIGVGFDIMSHVWFLFDFVQINEQNHNIRVKICHKTKQGSRLLIDWVEIILKDKSELKQNWAFGQEQRYINWD